MQRKIEMETIAIQWTNLIESRYVWNDWRDSEVQVVSVCFVVHLFLFLKGIYGLRSILFGWFICLFLFVFLVGKCANCLYSNHNFIFWTYSLLSISICLLLDCRQTKKKCLIKLQFHIQIKAYKISIYEILLNSYSIECLKWSRWFWQWSSEIRLKHFSSTFFKAIFR